MLLVESLNLMHPRFAAAHPLHEFYHQFRRLWDKALPVQLGLGHIIVQDDPDSPPGPRPDLLVWQIGEGGRNKGQPIGFGWRGGRCGTGRGEKG